VKRSLLVLAAGLLLALSAAPAHAACAASVRLGSEAYFPTSVPAHGGGKLKGGVIPACNDVVARDAQGNDISPREDDTPVALRRIRGVPARLAVAFEGRAYFARGYLPELAGHPLHAAWQRRNQVTPTACGKPWWVRATARITPSPGPVPVRTAGGRDVFLQLVADTRVAGLDVRGYPYLAEGQTVRALVRSCSSVYGGRVLLARSVTRT